ncbi:MAG: histidine kinase [Rhodospirillales bacterium]|nr:histidine kinase [Rhodospirillales bacterium]
MAMPGVQESNAHDAAPGLDVARPERRRGRSLLVRLAMLALVFIAVPWLLYDRFHEADTERQELLLESVRERGLVVAKALEPTLTRADSVPVFRLQEELTRFAGSGINLKLLFRPTGAEGGFFYVAAAPEVRSDALESERALLVDMGVLQKLADSCAGTVPLTRRVELPGAAPELLTSLTPIQTPRGCWVLVTAESLTGGRAQLGQSYWRLPEVQLAAAVYLAMVVLVFAILADVFLSIRGFATTARAVARDRADARFRESTGIAELAPVAAAFDRMVDRLRAAARSIRDAAEENAHAFKTPIATIRQAVEQMRRRIAHDDLRGQRALAAIEASLERLDNLVAAARQTERGAADLLDPPDERIDVAEIARGLAAQFQRMLPADGPHLEARVAEHAIARGGASLIEAALENLVENAVGFARQHVELVVKVLDGRIEVCVSDDGPGVQPSDLPRIFDRYFSKREGARAEGGNQGLGLWIVKRNAEALGGAIDARNADTGGLVVTLTLPRG